MNRYSYKLFIFSIILLFSIPYITAQKATVTINQDPRIPELLNLKKSLEKDNKLTDGYTIQLYYGELNKANEYLRRYKGTTSVWPASIEYETPNYKVWVGSYSSRLEADRALMEIQKTFNSAFILKPGKK